jgi:pimeloyl-ACP methyl ester carboxylesterase
MGWAKALFAPCPPFIERSVSAGTISFSRLTIAVQPTGYAQFPREILKPPRSAAERVFTDIRRWSIMSKGGHFAALEQPGLLAGEVRAFFRELR